MRSRLIALIGAAALVCGLTSVLVAQNGGVARASVSAIPGERTYTGGSISAERLQRIGQLIDRRIAANDIAGAVTLVAQRGQIVQFEARGLMDIESHKSMARDTLFDVASMTKPITAVAILMLVEEGRLRLTHPVSQVIPSFRNLTVKSATDAQAVPAAREITVRDLLTHTSGIVSEVRLPRDPAESLAHFIPTFATMPLEFQPGTRWKYSNTVGFDTLARIVEVVSGQNFDRFLRERIFTPMGMKDTGHRVDEARTARLATLYEPAAPGLRRLQLPDGVAYAAPAYFGGGGGGKTTGQGHLRL